MSVYGQELAAAQRQGVEAYEAMEAWVSRPLDAPEVPGAVLEGYARALRESRERLRKLVSENGKRDDIAAALAANEEYHRLVGLSLKDKREAEEDE